MCHLAWLSPRRGVLAAASTTALAAAEASETVALNLGLELKEEVICNILDMHLPTTTGLLAAATTTVLVVFCCLFLCFAFFPCSGNVFVVDVEEE